MLGACFAPLAREQQKAREKLGDAHGAGVHKKAFEGVLEAKADEGGGDAREDDVARFLELHLVAAEATHDDVDNLFAEYDENGEEGSCVKHDVEEHARFAHAEEGLADDQVTGTGNGKEFCETLQQAEDNGFYHAK